MSKEETDRLLKKKEKERDQQAQDVIADMEEHARCVLLPSPEEFDTPANPGGSDATGTLNDFTSFLKWAKKMKLENTFHLELHPGEAMEENRYESMVSFAFNIGYDALRNTKSPELRELMFCYYAGHGLDKDYAQELRYSAAPVLESRKPFFTEERKVKGGELCLHKFGFCDFIGLIDPFMVALKSQSINYSGEKKNKHLVIVLDSCHSGQFAEDLKDFFSENRSLLNEGCSVTVQTSCKSDEKAVGGYFTPTFIFLNDPNNKSVLDSLKGKWGEMNEREKNIFRSLKFSSPMMETTRNDRDNTSPTLKIEQQKFKMTLFRDAGFFKFCHCMVLGPCEITELPSPGNKSVLTSDSARDFLLTGNFNVMDFKLKTMANGLFEGEKIGLFLLKDPTNQTRAICAHVHFFDQGRTSKVGRINLVHHNYLPNSLLVLDYEEEDTTGLSKSQIKKGRYKIPLAMIPNRTDASEKDPSHWEAWEWNAAQVQTFSSLAQNALGGASAVHSKQCEIKCAMELVTECYKFVENKCQGVWCDLSKWNTTLQDPSFLDKFRKSERSASMKRYIEQVESYPLPTIKKVV